jgi:acyl carrier protein
VPIHRAIDDTGLLRGPHRGGAAVLGTARPTSPVDPSTTLGISTAAPPSFFGGGAEVIDGIDDEIRRIVGSYGQLSVQVDRVGPNDNLYRLGMKSHATLTVSMALEETFDIEFPPDLLKSATFESFSTMETAISELIDRRRTA